MAKQQKLWSTKCVLLVETDGWSEKPKRAGSSLSEGRLCPSAPLGSLHPRSPLRMSLFSMFALVLCSKKGSSVPADRQALWKFDCNAPPTSPSLFRGIVCCSCDILRKQKKDVCGLTFVLLLFCKCTIKYICWSVPVSVCGQVLRYKVEEIKSKSVGKTKLSLRASDHKQHLWDADSVGCDGVVVEWSSFGGGFVQDKI